MQPADRVATYADLMALPEDQRAEILNGVLETAPSPLPRHSRAQRAIGSFIGRPYDDDDGRGGPGGWWILLETDVQLSPTNVVRPDLAGWKRDRLPEPWDVRPIEVVPDWVCEVLSPSNASTDRVMKRRLYAQHGVAFYWLVDPEARTLEALELRGESWLEAGSWGDGDTARVPPFDEVELEVSRLFVPR